MDSDDREDDDPIVAVDPAGNWVVAWETSESGPTGPDNDIHFSHASNVLNVFSPWTEPAPLNTNAASDIAIDDNPALVGDGTGDWLAVWCSNNVLGSDPPEAQDFNIHFATSTEGGMSWSSPALLFDEFGTDSGLELSPDVATDGAFWMVVWSSRSSTDEGFGTDSDIHLARSGDVAGPFDGPFRVNSDAATDTTQDCDPTIATDGAAAWIVVWASRVSPDPNVEQDIRFALSTDAGDNWTDAAFLNNNAATDSGDDGFPHVYWDSAGWIVLWTSDDDLGGTIGTDLDTLIARSSDGMTWTDPAPLRSNAGIDASDDGLAVMATDGVQQLFAWESNENLNGTLGDDLDIFLARTGGRIGVLPSVVVFQDHGVGAGPSQFRTFRVFNTADPETGLPLSFTPDSAWSRAEPYHFQIVGPDALDFGVGEGPLDLTNKLPIPPGGFIDIPVRFSPKTPGEKSAFLLLKTNDPTLPVLSYPLVGRAVEGSGVDRWERYR